MRLELNRHPFLVGDPEPFADHVDHLLEGHDLADDGHELGPDILGEAQHRAQPLDGARKGGEAAPEARASEMRHG